MRFGDWFVCFRLTVQKGFTFWYFSARISFTRCYIMLLVSIDFGSNDDMCHRVMPSFTFNVRIVPLTLMSYTAPTPLSHCVPYYTANASMNLKTHEVKIRRNHLKVKFSCVISSTYEQATFRSRGVSIIIIVRRPQAFIHKWTSAFMPFVEVRMNFSFWSFVKSHKSNLVSQSRVPYFCAGHLSFDDNCSTLFLC